jgi:hypothetical protein
METPSTFGRGPVFVSLLFSLITYVTLSLAGILCLLVMAYDTQHKLTSITPNHEGSMKRQATLSTEIQSHWFSTFHSFIGSYLVVVPSKRQIIKNFKCRPQTRVARFFFVHLIKMRKNISNNHKIYVQNDHQIHQLAVKYLYQTAIKYTSKTLQNLPKMGFLV